MTYMVQINYRDGQEGTYECEERPFLNYQTSPSTIHLKVKQEGAPLEMIIPIDAITIISY